jgi:colanic acid biosynthesis glycosyl transferase WcaI
VALIFLNRYFHPDHSATSQILSDLAFALAVGRPVAVITSRQLYDQPDVRLPAQETTGCVRIIRVWTTRFGRSNLVGRAIDYLTFYVSAAWTLLLLARRGDVVIAKTDPPMLSVAAAPIALLRGAHLVNWLQDLFPEVAEAVGGAKRGLSHIGFRALTSIRDWSLRRAAMNVAVGDIMASRLVKSGVPADRVRVIPNWADGDAVRPVEPAQNSLRAAWDLSDAFVVGYSGNLGRAHEYATILDAIARLETAPSAVTAAPIPAEKPRRIVWLFIGGGAALEGLKREVALRDLRSAILKPYQPRSALAESLSVPDVHLISLKPELEGLIVPSKYYGIAAAGRPAIFIGDPDGELGRMLSRHGTGVTVPVGRGDQLAVELMRLAAEPERIASMGRRARELFEADYSLAHAIKRWNSVLNFVERNTSC